MPFVSRAFLLGALGGIAILFVFGFVERRAELLRVTDFSGFWAGARVLVEGGDPYDRSSWRAATERLGTQRPDTAVYGYPAHVAALLAPLAVLPFEVAASIWSVGGMLAAALALGALARRQLRDLPAAQALVGLALFASQPAITSFVIGQWTFWLVAAASLATLFALDGRWSAALPASGLLAKPQLALVMPFVLALAVRDRRRFAMVLALVALAAAAIAWLVAPGWLMPWLSEALSRRIASLPRNATIFGAAADVFGPAGIVVGAVAVVLAAAALWRFRARPREACVVGVALGSVVAPYAWGYDQLLLLVPTVAAAGLLDRPRAFGIVAVASAVLLLVAPAMYALAVTRGRESLSGVLPLALYVLVVAALWPSPRGERDRVSIVGT